jgi:2-keto-4-pentenoate hydratase
MTAQFSKRRARIAAGERPLGWKVGLGAPATMEKLGLDVNFQEVVHSALTGNADVAKPQ